MAEAVVVGIGRLRDAIARAATTERHDTYELDEVLARSLRACEYSVLEEGRVSI